MSSSPAAPDRIVLRGASGYWLTGILAAVMLFLLGDAGVRGAWDVVGRFAPWMALIVWAMYLVLIRPAVIVGRDMLRVQNPFVDHDIAWDSITKYNTRFQLTLTLTTGRLIGVWGGPAVKVGRPRLGRKDIEPAPLADEVVQDARRALGPLTSAPVSATRSKVNTVAVSVSVALLSVCVLSTVI